MVGGLAVITVAVVIAIVVIRGHQARGVADAIEAGRAHLMPSEPSDSDAADGDLGDAEVAAGEVWAKHHHPRVASDCPADPAAFHRGCLGWVVAERPR